MQRLIALILLTISFAFSAGEMDLFSGSASMGSASRGPSSRSAVALNPAYAEVPVDSSYILGPGDFLDLMLEDSYLSVQVYPDGSVAIEECGSVVVGGKTLAEARELILDLAAKRNRECRPAPRGTPDAPELFLAPGGRRRFEGESRGRDDYPPRGHHTREL